MEKRRLGRTGHLSSVVTFGSYSIGKLDQDAADRVIQLSLDHGVNLIDIAPGYAKANIMDRMNVDSFDLFQLHSVIDPDTLDIVTSDGGALQTLIEMKDQGLTQWIGITGHGPSVPRTHIEALHRYDFDTVMFPVNATMYKNSKYRADAEELIRVCNKKDVGIQAIKMLARGGWEGVTPDIGTWYDAHREQADIEKALWWQLSQPIHTAPSCGESTLLPIVLEAAERFEILSEERQQEIVDGQNPPRPHPALAIL